ncbi:DNA alkylation repair protein [Arthrobacter sp. AK01]|uniref:DNA alkylation repair protein n=1 Tax=Micrococcaceae TaxID=1268 RepID=UPI001E52CE03|nr:MULTISPECIES: DNA alkylation repair protein [Micrococcaceae]MCD4850941.1 DNA alkylation repair protein [Arthrobacter sp. AK01]MCP1415118.1 3-methyladenine DNA glycosylase AlkD [Paenarthrobacter sp. A20]
MTPKVGKTPITGKAPKAGNSGKPAALAPGTQPTAVGFLERLKMRQSDVEQAKYQRYFKTGQGDYAEGDFFMGVRMGEVFTLAKEFAVMPLDEIEQLLEEDIHEARAGAVKIMSLQAQKKKTTEAVRQSLYELYLRRHDRINNWDLVDLGAGRVVGGWLMDKPRDPLYELARSEDMWERRTAIVATSAFIREGQLDDTFAIAQILLADQEDLIHKAVGGWVRDAGRSSRERLLAFLDEHAATMPRTTLRYAIEHLGKEQRAHYLTLKDRVSPN